MAEQRLINTSMNTNTFVSKIGWNSLHWVLRYGVRKVFWSLPAVTLTFDVNSMSQVHVHTWPNFGESYSNIYEYIRFMLFLGHCLRWPWPFDVISKSQSCDQNLAKFPSLVFDIRCLWGFRVIACCDLDLLTSEANQYIYQPKYICDHNWANFPSEVLPRDRAMLARYVLSLYVRPSVTSRSCTKMAKRRITVTTPYDSNDSPGTLVFRRQKSRRNSNDMIPNGGAK